MKKVIGVVLGIMGILLFVGGIVTKIKGYMTFSIIGGADGPTSVFIAGKLGDGFSEGLLIIGCILLVSTGIILYKRKGRKNE